jgi:hypothetical protein
MGTVGDASRGVEFAIRECTLADLRAIIPRLRSLDRIEAESAGMPVRHLFVRLWFNSPFRRTALLDGEIACVGGYTGDILSCEGGAWLFTTAAVERRPIAFLKGLRQMVQEMLETKHSLTSGVLAEYERSIRLMKMVGFRVGEPQPTGANGAMFRELRMER